MIVSELDRRRAALQLINSHGRQVGRQAGFYVGDFSKKSFQAGLNLWMDIAFKIAQLEKKSSNGIPLN